MGNSNRVYESTSPNVSKDVYEYYYEPTTNSLEVYDLTAGQSYYYRVSAVDTSENESELSQINSEIPEDLTKPEPPWGLSAIGGENIVYLGWIGSIDTVAGYNVYRKPAGGNYTKIASLVKDTYYDDTDVIPDTTYYYYIKAESEFGIESDASNESYATPYVTPPPDTTPPARPTITSITPKETEIELAWTQNTELDWSQYRIYRNDAGPTPIFITSDKYHNYYTDKELQPATDYTYKITAKDTSGNESSPYEIMVTTQEPFLYIKHIDPDVINPEGINFTYALIKYYLKESCESVTLKIYTSNGELIFEEINSNPQPSITLWDPFFKWDGHRQDTGGFVTDGVYDIEIIAGIPPSKKAVSTTQQKKAVKKGGIKVQKRESDKDFATGDWASAETGEHTCLDAKKFKDIMESDTPPWISRGDKWGKDFNINFIKEQSKGQDNIQADILYFSGDGYRDGSIALDLDGDGDYESFCYARDIGIEIDLTIPNNKYYTTSAWDADTEWVIFGLCSILDCHTEGEKDVCGLAWAKTLCGYPNPAHGLFGYHGSAPGGGIDVEIVRRFLDKCNKGMSMKDAWKQVNWYDPEEGTGTYANYAIIMHAQNQNDTLSNPPITNDVSLNQAPQLKYWYMDEETDIYPFKSSLKRIYTTKDNGRAKILVPIPTIKSQVAPLIVQKEELTKANKSSFLSSSVKSFDTGILVMNKGIDGKEKALSFSAEEAKQKADEFIKTQGGGLPEDAELASITAMKVADLDLNEGIKNEIVEGYMFEYNHKYKGIPIAGDSDSIRVLVKDDEVKYYYKCWRKPMGFGTTKEQKRQIISAEKALNVALANKNKVWKVPENYSVTNIDLAYYGKPSIKAQQELIPVWRIEIDQEVYLYVNAYTGELINHWK
ncbi:MAG: hypothetical protein AB1414_01875 [bacterium]